MILNTQHFKLKELFPKRAKDIAKEIKIEADDIDYIRKGIPTGGDISVKKEERAVIRYITTASIDRDKEIVVPSGAILDDFRENPSVLYAHKYGDLPVGKDIWIKIDEKGVLAKTVYAKHQFADDVYNLVTDGFLRANSIGFIPVKAVTKEDKKEWKTAAEMLMKDYGLDEEIIDGAERIYTKWLLLEHSDVPVPSNPQALNLAVSKGEVKIYSEQIKKDLELEIVEKPETTENYHRIPVRDCEITATIDISKKEGIKALYCGKIKKIGTYLFDVDKWTMAEAKKWVKEHGKEYEGDTEEKEINEKSNIDNTSEFEVTDVETVEEKEGRVLSAKNRKLIKTCIDELQKLYEATETTEPKEFVIEASLQAEMTEEAVNKIIEKQTKKNKEIILNELNKMKENINKILVNKLGIV